LKLNALFRIADESEVKIEKLKMSDPIRRIQNIKKNWFVWNGSLIVLSHYQSSM